MSIKRKKHNFLKYCIFILFIGGLIHLNIEPLYTPTAITVGSTMFNFPAIIAHKAIVSGDYFPGNSFKFQISFDLSYYQNIH